MNYRLENLLDIQLLQNLQDKLNVIYSFPSAIIDNDGKVLTSVAWQDICTKFHRANHECEKECIKSDKYILEHLHEAKPAVSYLCPHGLTDNATPIIIDGTHLGNFFTGQFFLEKPDLSFFRKQAKKYGFDEEAYLEAVEKVPIWTREKLNQYLDFIKGFIEIIAGLGYKNLKEIETNKILKESELKYRSLIENSNDAVYCVDEKGEYKFTNRYFASIFDKTPEYFIGKTFWDILDKENADARYKVTKSVFKNALSESSEIEVRLSEKILNFWATSNPIRDETGKVILILTHATNITELKNTQKELEELIALNSNIINSARSGIIVYDDRLRYKIWNPFMEKLSGIPASKIVGRHPGEVFPFLEHTAVVANLEKVLKGENVDAIDFPFELPKIGKKGWTSDSNAALRNSDGKIIGVIGTVHDITDRKLREEEVEKARILAEENEIKARYLSIDLNKAQSVAKVGSWKWHINENRLDFSNEMFNIFGVEKDNFYGNLDEIIQWIHQEDMEKVVASKNSVIEKGIAVPIEFRILLPDNTIKFLWAEAGEMIYDKNDKPQVINGIVRDITEQRMKDRILHESEEKYSTLFHQTIDGIALHSLIFDEDNVLIDYVFIDVNEAFQNIINIRKEDVIGKKASQIIPPEELKKWLSIFAPVATNGASCRYENFSESNNKYFEGVAFSTKKNHFATIFRDVTENKLMELDLIRAKEKAEESDHLKTAFLRNMSHEVRTPLNAIAGFSSIIADKLYSDEKLQEYAKIITGNSDKLIGIITDVIEISQIQASQFKVNLTEIKLQAFIDKIVNPFYDRMKNINVQLLLQKKNIGDDTIFISDVYKLERILFHVLDNAFKFTHKGSISIHIELLNNSLRIFVSDTGIGIGEDHQQYIFEPFRQVDTEMHKAYGGLGLGLALVKSYVEILHGNLSVKSEIGKGTAVTIVMPTEDFTQSQILKIRKEKTSKKNIILIAEDNQDSYLFLKEVFESEGMTVAHASNGQIAVEICRSNNNIALVLMNFKMPVMDGIKAAKQIKEIRQGLPIIALTAYADALNCNTKFECFDEYVTKPIRVNTFKAMIFEYLG